MGDVFEGVELTPAQKHELDTLRRGFAALDGLISDPKMATATKRLLRQKYPDRPIAIPEDDIAAPLVAGVEEKITAVSTKADEALAKIAEAQTALETKFAERDQKETDAADLKKMESSIDSVVKKHRFTDEGKTALIRHMMDTHTSDAETAASHLLMNMEKPQPVASSGIAPAEARRNGAPDVDLFHVATGHDDESLKLLHTKPEQWMVKEVQKVLDEGVTTVVMAAPNRHDIGYNPRSIGAAVSQQPSGQRVTDLVEFAVKILKQYPDALAADGFKLVPLESAEATAVLGTSSYSVFDATAFMRQPQTHR